jgi:hypothetical protein
MAELHERCQEREKLLAQWTDKSGRLTTLLDQQLAAIRTAAPDFARFAEKIWIAKAAEIEACRAYYDHVNKHGCV